MLHTERGILKRSVSIMMTNFLKWKHDYRVWFVFLMEGFLVGQSMSGLIRYALFMKKTVTPFLLPFLFFDSSIANGLLKVMVYFGVIVLFCNAPFCDTTLYSVIARSKKKAWWLGNCFYIMLTSAVYLLYFCLICAVMSIPVITFKLFWGSVVQSILMEDADVLNSYMGSLTFSKDVLQTIYPDSAQWMTFGIAWLSFTGIGFLIYAVNQLSGKYRLGSIVASFFVLLDPVVRWIVLRSYWMYYISPVSWSSIEHWKILGTERPLNQNIIIPANVIICIVLFIIAGMGTRRKDITV